MNVNTTTIKLLGDTKEINLVGFDTETNESIDKTISSYGVVNMHPLIDFLYSQKPISSTSENEFKNIIVNVGVDAIYEPKDESASWVVLYSDIKQYLIMNLIDEILITP